MTESKTISDSMIIAGPFALVEFLLQCHPISNTEHPGAQRLASLSPALKDPDDALLPDFEDAPAINFEIAVAVAEHAVEEGLANVKWKKEEVRERLKERVWHPFYGTYKYDSAGER